MSFIKPTMVASAISLALIGMGTSGALHAAHPTLGAQVGLESVAGIGESETGRYIVTFVEQGLVQYRGGIAGLARTAPGVDGVSLNSSKKFVMDSAAAQQYQLYLQEQRKHHLDTMQRALGHALDIHYTYDVTRSGISVSLRHEEALRVAALPGVLSVTPVQRYETQTTRGPTFIGANTIWDGSAIPSWASASRGQGVKVGIIDTGTFIGHPSFTNDPACGFSAASPKLFPRDCTTNSGTHCTGTLPDADRSSHGVHTSSTAAGNTLSNASAPPAPPLPNGVTMSGVAPCASIYSYNVANHSDGSLANDALEAAIQHAIVDQVDVVNYSIGRTCGTGNPWADQRMLSFLDASDADVFIAASAGNTRDTCTNPDGLVGNNGPWILTVANSTQDEIVTPTLTVVSPGPVPATLEQIPLTPGSTTLSPSVTLPMFDARIKVSPNLEACTAGGGIPAGTFTSADVAIVRRGSCGFAEKITNAYNAGARTVIVANNQAGTISMNTSGAPGDVAAFSIGSQAIGDALFAFIAAPPGEPIFKDGFEDGAGSALPVFGDYLPLETLSRQGDVINGGSLRGPTQGAYENLTKPDITGPGTDIYAAYMAAEGNYGLMTGTSMSSPHLAGAAALVRAIHPTWSPQEVKSALQTTAKRSGFMEDGTTPWTPDVVGSGRVDLSLAALAGLTLDETKANYLAANPTGGSISQTQLNLASLRNVACGASCSWTRTVTNRLDASGTWNVAFENPAGYTLSASPTNFTLAPDATQTITVTATANAAPTQSISFGAVLLQETGNAAPDQHLTVAIKGETPVAPPGYCDGGACVLKIDTMPDGGSFSGVGCASYCGLVWLNQFSPPAAEYPITITAVQSIFGNPAGWNAAGDKIHIYIYLDNDADPTNGATLLGQHTYTQPTPANAWRNIALSTPVVVNGPGHILIAMTNPTGNTGTRPVSADPGPFNGHGWIGDYADTATGVAPDLSAPAIGLLPNDQAISGFDRNWLIRATGTNGGGRPISLEPVTH